MKGIVPHGGRGTRLSPLTYSKPKQLIPVANKPISKHVLEDLKNSGVKDVAIVVGHIQPEEVKNKYGDGSELGLNITYIKQEEPKGIAQAVELCEDFVGDEEFVVYLGDNLLKHGINRLVGRFEGSGSEALVFLDEVENPEQFGVAKFDKDGDLEELIEKPEKPPSSYALTGVYFFTPEIFEMIDELELSWRGELEITDAIQMLLEKGYQVDYEFVRGWWKDIGTPEDVLKANRLVLDEMDPKSNGDVPEKSCTHERVFMERGSKIEKEAIVRGPTIIGENSVIRDGVYIGPYTSVGDEVEIKNGEIENSIVMDNCTIDVEDRIIDSLIGSKSEIKSDEERTSGKRLVLGENSNITF